MISNAYFQTQVYILEREYFELVARAPGHERAGQIPYTVVESSILCITWLLSRDFPLMSY